MALFLHGNMRKGRRLGEITNVMGHLCAGVSFVLTRGYGLCCTI